MNKIMVLVIFLCLMPVAQAGAETTRYWLNGSINGYLYEDSALRKQSRIRTTGYATVSLGEGVTKVTFDNGTVRYIESKSFHVLSRDDYDYIMTETQRLDLGPEDKMEDNRILLLQKKRDEKKRELADQQKKDQEEAEKAAAEERAEQAKVTSLQRGEIKAELKMLGFSNGTKVWTKLPIEFHPGLAKLVIKDVRIVDNLDIQVDYESEYRADMLVFESVDNLKGTFFFKYPSQWGGKFVKAIKNGEINLGMTKDQAIASIGRPSNINRTGGSWGIHEQWVYDKGVYLYFKNGHLTSWQD